MSSIRGPTPLSQQDPTFQPAQMAQHSPGAHTRTQSRRRYDLGADQFLDSARAARRPRVGCRSARDGIASRCRRPREAAAGQQRSRCACVLRGRVNGGRAPSSRVPPERTTRAGLPTTRISPLPSRRSRTSHACRGGVSARGSRGLSGHRSRQAGTEHNQREARSIEKHSIDRHDDRDRYDACG
jgi:hypothetical protein